MAYGPPALLVRISIRIVINFSMTIWIWNGTKRMPCKWLWFTNGGPDIERLGKTLKVKKTINDGWEQTEFIEMLEFLFVRRAIMTNDLSIATRRNTETLYCAIMLSRWAYDTKHNLHWTTFGHMKPGAWLVSHLTWHSQKWWRSTQAEYMNLALIGRNG